MYQKPGVLPSQRLEELMGSFIEGVPKKYINSSSLDLPLGEEAYRLECVFLPRKGEKVRNLLDVCGATPHDLKSPLEVGVTYLVHLNGNIELPEHVYAYANPKSTAGRLNLSCRLVADDVPRYDTLPAGWNAGELWLLLRADSFPILMSVGSAASQLRFFTGPAFLDPLELQNAIRKDGLLFHPGGARYKEGEYDRHADSIYLSIGVAQGHVGWECRGTTRVLDYNKVGCYKPEPFFVPMHAVKGSVRLRKNSFYILTTSQFIRVPRGLSAELRATDPRVGNFTVHTAGYIDEGWGVGQSGEIPGLTITLEVTVHEDNVLLRDGQNVARIRYERMYEPSEKPYHAANSNYTNQVTARLSKHFVV